MVNTCVHLPSPFTTPRWCFFFFFVLLSALQARTLWRVEKGTAAWQGSQVETTDCIRLRRCDIASSLRVCLSRIGCPAGAVAAAAAALLALSTHLNCLSCVVCVWGGHPRLPQLGNRDVSCDSCTVLQIAAGGGRAATRTRCPLITRQQRHWHTPAPWSTGHIVHHRKSGPPHAPPRGRRQRGRFIACAASRAARWSRRR